MSNRKYRIGEEVNVPAHLNFGKFILDRLRVQTQDKVALENIDTKQNLTYKEFTQYAVNLSAALTRLGVGRGDTVGVGSEVRIDILPTALAIIMTGATLTGYESWCGKAIFRYKMKLSQPKYFICSNKFWCLYKDLIQEFDCIKMILSLDDPFDCVPCTKDLTLEDVDVESFEPATVLGQTDVAIIYYSSGTTGLAKGVQLTHLNYMLYCLPYGVQDDSIQTGFIYGRWHGVYTAIMTFKFLILGKKMVYPHTPDNELRVGESILRSIDQYKVNMVMVTPIAITSFLREEHNLHQYNLDSLKVIYSGGASLHLLTIKKLKERFVNLNNLSVLQIYGMTEVGMMTLESHSNILPGSVGKPFPGITIKISDVETRGTLGANERGEICVKSSAIMKGYVGADLDLDDEGFFKTGDLGYYDEEGYFFIDGRLKEIIKCGGAGIPPMQLEAIIQLHPAVKDVAVIGKPDPIHDEIPTAFVVRQPGYNVTEEELVDYIYQEVSPQWQLRGGVKFIDEVPRNQSGKILKQQLKDMLQEV